MRRILVYPTAGSVPRDLTGSWQPVVIDVLRATSAIAAALANGAAAVIPVNTPEEALQKRLLAPADTLAAGERDGMRIDGFDLGNSPLEMSSARLEGRRIYLCTTNGTRAILAAAPYGDVMCAAFVNLGAVVRRLRATDEDLLVVCAGTADTFSADDVAVAGALLAQMEAGSAPWASNDMGVVARHWYEAYKDDLPGMLAATAHGRYLAGVGSSHDVTECGHIDRWDVVPIYRKGKIVRA